MTQSAMRVLTRFIGATALLSGTAFFFGCAVDADASPQAAAMEGVASRQQAVFGGEPTDDPKYAAVGALSIKFEIEFEPGVPFVIYEPFCSGTLVGDKAVLTARHCTEAAARYAAEGLELYFAFGSFSWEADQAIPIVDWVQAPPSPTHPGLLLDGGRDVAVAYLAETPVGIEPAKVAQFKDKQADDEFEIIGFGYNDFYFEEFGFYESGTKIVGKSTGRSLGGQWYSLLFDGDYDAYLEWYFADAATETPSEEEALEWWNIYHLEPGYELLAGSTAESHGCFGDSGGPLASSKKDKLTVYGVGFAVESSRNNLCTGGSAYLVLNSEMLSFVKKAIKNCPN